LQDKALSTIFVVPKVNLFRANQVEAVFKRISDGMEVKTLGTEVVSQDEAVL